jgi:hypothetical protein
MESRSPDPVAPPSPEASPSLAEDLPELYRTILERVADLERAGRRRDAGLIRADATRAYSRAWDDGARRLLVALLSRADRALTSPARTTSWSLRSRIPAAR